MQNEQQKYLQDLKDTPAYQLLEAAYLTNLIRGDHQCEELADRIFTFLQTGILTGQYEVKR